MSSDRDIYGKGNELERLAQRIHELRIEGASKDKMLEFKRHLFLSGRKQSTFKTPSPQF